jgi:hypothetical protein
MSAMVSRCVQAALSRLRHAQPQQADTLRQRIAFVKAELQDGRSALSKVRKHVFVRVCLFVCKPCL